MSDESVPEKKIQYVLHPRSWRQRYAGPDGEYVYRRMISVRGPNGKLRRVVGGERVDCEADGITPRRLKALWFAKHIELADAAALVPRTLKKNIVDNRAIRLEEERLREEEDAKLAAVRDKRRELNALRREADEQRRLAERAVRAAEDRERREIDDMILAEEAAEREVKIQEILEQRAIAAAEEATLEEELASEQAQLRVEQADIARARQEQVEQELGEEQARLEQGTRDRIEAREAELQKNRAVPDEEPPAPNNPNAVFISMDEAKAALEE